MADRIAKYLSDYFSSVIEMQIRLRIRELETPTSFDENIGGGKAENKRNIQTENDIIIQESDYILQSFIRDRWFMSNFLKVLTSEEIAMLELRYDRRRKRSWLQVAKHIVKVRESVLPRYAEN
ncbi:DUF722 domain-containing protein [Leuconostoc pseudomesenteroides]|uniref:DUF722 domain-containing protein n=1 Tax=Leuconostoc pseudomesenteroides TaxID=33968 RepID=A0ABT6HEG2_LEUPS|nr:DUF722 domain-containing protein [Leuconostoc pseudomesenteroides]MDG9734439.1 DUF722 domain-containing protein [Leuconostoc pseudomesenteroides]